MTVEQFTTLSIYVLTGILGLCVGSFLNVVIYRFPNGMNLSKPGSHCTTCDYSLKWYDNIPILSYIILGGKCRNCKEKISPRYMLVELSNALLWLLAVFIFFEKSIPYAVMAAIVSSVLICIFFIDLEHMLIFNRFTILVALGGLVAIYADTLTKWYDHLIGAAAGGILFLALYYGCILVIKKEGLGFGDVKYAAAAGFLLGWQKFILAILIASVVGAVVMSILNRVNNSEKHTEHPFGPYLAAATLISMFFGNQLIEWYLNLLINQI